MLRGKRYYCYLRTPILVNSVHRRFFLITNVPLGTLTASYVETGSQVSYPRTEIPAFSELVDTDRGGKRGPVHGLSWGSRQQLGLTTRAGALEAFLSKLTLSPPCSTEFVDTLHKWGQRPPSCSRTSTSLQSHWAGHTSQSTPLSS
jgi:hypothetical protein